MLDLRFSVSTNRKSFVSFFRSAALFSFLIFGLGLSVLAGCSQTQEMISQCDPAYDDFEEDFSRHVERQEARSEHKALAHSTDTSGCFAVGYGDDHSSRQEAIDRAMAECESNIPESQSCTLYSVNGEQVEQ